MQTTNINKLILVFSLLSSLSHITFAQDEAVADKSSRTIFQVAPIASLAKGVYDGDYTYGELKKHGDFGLGTFLDLDGEMIALDGKFYQMLDNGHYKLVDDKQIVPFAEVNYFLPTIKNQQLPPMKSYSDLSNYFLNLFPNKNVPYAIRIDGKFETLEVRVVRKQKPPFTTLANAAKTEKVFTLKNVEGTLIGYWFPAYLSGVAVSGFHFHFIDKAHTIGGHVLELDLLSGTLNLEQMTNLNIYFPNTTTFIKADLNDKSIVDNINKAEKSH